MGPKFVKFENSSKEMIQKATYSMGKNICSWDEQGINTQNIKTAHKLYIKTNNLILKIGGIPE